jgi:hypothetical protein
MATEKPDEKQKPKPPDAPDSAESELVDEELDGVSGGATATGSAGTGKVAVHDISITKVVDKSSP